MGAILKANPECGVNRKKKQHGKASKMDFNVSIKLNALAIFRFDLSKSRDLHSIDEYRFTRMSVEQINWQTCVFHLKASETQCSSKRMERGWNELKYT